MTCDCNCHYGTKEKECKNCNCNKFPQFPVFETVCRNCSTINRFPLPIPKDDQYTNLICSECDCIIMTVYGKKHHVSVWINGESRNE